MIPKKIHQIYFNWQNKDVSEIELFSNSIKIAKKVNPDFEHKLWTEDECSSLVKNHYPQYDKFYHNFRYEIQKIDFIRFCILHHEGGFYMDLDMHCIKSFNPLTRHRILLHNIKHLNPNTTESVVNDFIGSTKGYKFWELTMRDCVYNYERKASMEIYDVWKARFVLQTTGPKFLARCLKKYIPDTIPDHVVWTKWKNEAWKEIDRNDYYVECFKAGTWLNHTNKNLK